jgi:type II secretory ATPase GspE/PulE/Tfp pilus assembly ATPase PilB-like protein
MDNNIKDWYDIINKKNKQTIIKPDIDFNKHYILPCSMILMIGGTGSGKSTILCEFLLNRKNKAFYEVIIFNPVNVDEPIYNFLYKLNSNI